MYAGAAGGVNASRGRDIRRDGPMVTSCATKDAYTHKTVRSASVLVHSTFVNTFAERRGSLVTLPAMLPTILERITDAGYGIRITREIWGTSRFVITV